MQESRRGQENQKVSQKTSRVHGEQEVSRLGDSIRTVSI